MSNSRDYTIQYLEEMDWIRVTAIYDSFDDVLEHAKKLIADGIICRVIMRRDDSEQWHTIRIGLDGQIKTNYPVQAPK